MNIFDRLTNARDLDPVRPAIAVDRVMQPLGASLVALGLLPTATPATPAALAEALKQFQRAHHLPPTGVLGHDDALEFAQALSERGLPTAAFTAAVRAGDPEAFGHDIEWPVVKKGAKSTAVRLIQLRANDLGVATLTADGDFGAATEAAVLAAQQSFGLARDGVVGKDTWQALAGGMAALKQGDSGEAVHIAQLRLMELGYATFTPTQTFDAATLDSLHSFQTEGGLPLSDVIDEDTWRYLFGSTFSAGGDFTADKADLDARVDGGIGAIPAASQALVSAVMKEAIGWYGIREQPEGSNRGPEVEQLVGTRGWAWCALAVSAWLKRGLHAASWAEIPFQREMAAANSIRAWGFDGGRFLAAGNVPCGAIFIMNRGTTQPTAPSAPFEKGHTGFVVEDHGSSLLTIEGNSHDAVRSVERDKSTLVGCLTWWA